ncbi:MAG: sigma-54 dependent transcriptional regulator [Hyphomicrobiales bacterium]
MDLGTILFVDDEEHIRNSMAQAFELAEMDYECFSSPNEMMSKLNTKFNGIVVSDIRMQPMDGIALLEYVQKIDSEIPIILMTGHGDIELAVSSLQLGAHDFFEKPYNNTKFFKSLNNALEKRRLFLKLVALQNPDNQNHLDVIIGDSVASKTLKRQVKTIASTNVDILINGATGVGKELIANTLHKMSNRSKAPFVAINCGALPLSIIESELFGHEKGAFTGATERRIGKFEFAQGGTIFLDEIESMPMDLQVKLLRILQERNLERLGSNKLINLDVRIIAASKKDLLEESQKGLFREDLYYRLNVAVINIPSLDVRKNDILLLAKYFVEHAANRHNIKGLNVDLQKLMRLENLDWPGNVRELKNYCERIALGIDDSSFSGSEIVSAETIPLQERVRVYEKQEIVACLHKYQGHVQSCCDDLGLPRKTFYDKLSRYALNRSDYINIVQ